MRYSVLPQSEAPEITSSCFNVVQFWMRRVYYLSQELCRKSIQLVHQSPSVCFEVVFALWRNLDHRKKLKQYSIPNATCLPSEFQMQAKYQSTEQPMHNSEWTYTKGEPTPQCSCFSNNFVPGKRIRNSCTINQAPICILTLCSNIKNLSGPIKLHIDSTQLESCGRFKVRRPNHSSRIWR